MNRYLQQNYSGVAYYAICLNISRFTSLLFSMKHFILAFLSLIVSAAYSQHADSAYSTLSDVDGRLREHNVDFTKIQLDIKFMPLQGKVIGKEVLYFTPIQPIVDSIWLDAPGIHIKSVKLDKVSVPFDTNTKGVIIHLYNKPLHWDTAHSLTVEYEAHPPKGLYFIGWNDERNLSRKQIWTQGQGVDNRYWFPCYDDADDKVITETNITFDKAYTVVSNGRLLSSTLNADSTKTWHYAMTKPHAPYLVMIAIDKYAWRDVKSQNGITTRQYYYADRPEVYTPTYEHSAEMMDWLEHEIGVPYPWESYSNTPVQDFMYGAMENTTATVFGDFYQLDARSNIERPYIATNAHELTHQWFGDYITEYSGTHHWLHESFATYYSKMYMRHVLGEDSYQWAMRGEASAAIAEDNKNRYPVAHTKGGTNRHYPKGSFVIGMLRYVLGDAVYTRCVSRYLRAHALGHVDTHDFYRTFMDNTGINLDWFFDEWVYHSGYPTYRVRRDVTGTGTRFVIAQTQHTDSLVHLFRMPVVLAVHYTDGSRDTVRTWVASAADTVTIPNASHKPIAYTVFDPEAHIIKTLDFTRSYPELITQASRASNMIDRMDAIRELRDTPVSIKRADLCQLYYAEHNHIIRTEIIYQLSSDTAPATIELLQAALRDSHYLVRRAAIDDLDHIPDALLPACEALLADTSYYTIESTLRKLVRQHPERKAQYLDKTKYLIGITKNVHMAWLELQCDSLHTIYRDELVEFTSHSFEFRTRVRAMDALERLNYLDDTLLANMTDAMANPNTRLANPAFNSLSKLLNTKERKNYFKAYVNSHSFKPAVLERLKGLM
jgi:aminopeptidase N